MLQHPTLDQLKQLKLHGMARAFVELGDNPQADELAHAEWLALLLDREEAERNDRRLTYRLRNARLRHPNAAVEDVDYRTPRRLDKALFQHLARSKWIGEKRNLIIVGPCGVGKSWLACALGQKACRDDHAVLYKRMPRMFAELEMGRADGRYPSLFRALTKASLLILDDWGPDRLNAEARRDLMEIVEDRYQNASTLITSQLPLAKWHQVIGEATFADAILDRIVHNAHKIELDGPSMRKITADKNNPAAIDQTEGK
jgi:DNA replication protein DnaC